MKDWELKNIIIQQTTALEAAIHELIAERENLYESFKDRNGQVRDDDIRLKLLRLDNTIEQCQTAVIAGRAMQANLDSEDGNYGGTS